jgi:DNA-binding CsgD family transcriptional regulator
MDWHDKLTAREREVLALREAGKTVREIGEALHMTPGVVRLFFARIEFKRGNE